jgi:hypothetical protein
LAIYWLGIAGRPTDEQRERLDAAGLFEKAHSGEAFSGTIYRTYFLVNAPDDQAALNEVISALPELRQEWDETPPHLILVTDP